MKGEDLVLQAASASSRRKALGMLWVRVVCSGRPARDSSVWPERGGLPWKEWAIARTEGARHCDTALPDTHWAKPPALFAGFLVLLPSSFP